MPPAVLWTSCGTQRLLRPLSGPCILLATAPTAPPCFGRRPQSSPLHNQRKNDGSLCKRAKPAGFALLLFHGWGRRGKLHSAHILFHRITQECGKHNRRNICLPVCKTKRTCSLAGTRPFYHLSIRQRSAYSWGPAETRALPCSLPSYFLKFLMKRLARSLAFSSHWEASA